MSGVQKDDLIRRMRGFEWDDIEFKSASRTAPKSAYETVSAFSNSNGGWIVFGVSESGQGYEVHGVKEVDKVQAEFLSAVASRQKFSRSIQIQPDVIEYDGRILLVFRISEANRREKPVYLDGDIRRSFIRVGATNRRCSKRDIESMLLDARDVRYEAQHLKLNPRTCYDPESLAWYRKLIEDQSPSVDPTLSNAEFLRGWAFLADSDDGARPTRASILLFGSPAAFRQILPRPTIDCQWFNGRTPDENDEVRWTDRIVIEDNIIKAWRTLATAYRLRAETPFSIDRETLRRIDDPPEYIAFREAAVNLLIHQDYADVHRTPVIRFFRDNTVLWNPGDAFVPTDELTSAGEREVRNPSIVAALRRIGLSEQAGTGLRAIMREWRRLGYTRPILKNDRARRTFELGLPRAPIVSEWERDFQNDFSIPLSSDGSRAFALACLSGRIGAVEVRDVTGLSTSDAEAVLRQLASHGLLTPVGFAPPGNYEPSLLVRFWRVYRVDPEKARKWGIVSLRTSLTDEPLRPVLVHRELGIVNAVQRSDQTFDLVTKGGDEDPSLVTDTCHERRSLVTGEHDEAPSLVTGRRDEDPSLVTDTCSERQSLVTYTGPKLAELGPHSRGILELCLESRDGRAIMERFSFRHRSHFRAKHLKPLLKNGLIVPVFPDQPRHPRQGYTTTKTGRAALEASTHPEQPN